MKVEQLRWTPDQDWQGMNQEGQKSHLAPQLVLVFGETAVLKQGNPLKALRSAYPNAQLLGCSTAGEICDTQVTDGSLVATALHFEQTQIRGHAIHLNASETSYQAGARLAQAFDSEGLVHLFILSDGLAVNGSDLIQGLRSHLPPSVTFTGGLSGDGSRFQETVLLWNDEVATGMIAAVGFYGDRLRVGYGSQGGWKPFGPKRMITKSRGNLLYELDGKSALELYKTYLGKHAAGLPATGLLFPLRLEGAEGDRSVVRTILAIDEEEASLTFAGDVPEGNIVQFMQANIDLLVDGAIAAAEVSLTGTPVAPPEFAVLISCVGRKLVLKQRIEEEVEGIREVMGVTTALTGFYSYGEIAPAAFGEPCQLHNQTMTITTFLEQ
jgi:hypothetical protein